jgi:hypothetical protein
MREDVLNARNQSDFRLYEESIKLGNEVASILRKNFVQASKQNSNGEDIWSMSLCLLMKFIPSQLP